jgi:prepilin-type N-terminal cleavage/methylation domain-containing protein
MRMRNRNREQGFTLIELLVVMSILVLVVGAASAITITLMRVSPHSTSWSYALRQVQNAGFWISRDVEMSQGDIDVSPPSPKLLSLTVPYGSAGDNKTVDYQFETQNGELWLMRNDSIEGQTAVAQYISDTDVQYNPGTHTLTFSLSAQYGKTPAITRQYKAMQRVSP